ncbi:ferric reductase-like transmembrane domain-containing protein [Actinomycetes bacterium M1A6_2h]
MSTVVPSRHADAMAVRTTPRWWRDASGAAMWILLLFVTALWVSNRGAGDLFGGAAAAVTSAGRLAGLLASALLLVQVSLMARIPFVERAWGQGELTRLHRVVGFTSFSLMLGHIGLVTIGYAGADPGALWTTAVDLVVDYPGVLLATAGTAALILVVITSARAARRRLRYESWHLIHLYGYVGAGLALPHQLWTGQDFLSSPVSTWFWWGLYIACAASVLLWRIVMPLWSTVRAGLRVSDVRYESANVVSVTVGGPGVRHLRAQGGQFLQWRFLGRTGWTRAQPYSLSAAPTETSLRFTAAIVGDGTAKLPALEPGTRVLVEGPYGRLHAGTRTGRKALLIGAGIGITPLRALLESASVSGHDITMIHRVRSAHDAVLRREIEQLAWERGAEYRLVEGPRITDRDSWLPRDVSDWNDTAVLLDLCPDVAERDVFVCGPRPWAAAVRRAARQAGVPAGRLHLESFDF